MQNFLSRLIPFLIIGFILVVLIAGLVLLSYLLIFGAILGSVLYLIAWIRDKFFPSKDISQPQPPREQTGRTFDHDEFKK